MQNLKQIWISALLLLMMAVVSSCMDDFPYGNETYGDGKSEITLQMDFSNIVHTISNTRTAGDAIKNINSLCIFFYRKDDDTNSETYDQFLLYSRVPVTGIDFDKINRELTNSETSTDAIPERTHKAEDNSFFQNLE